MAIQINFLSNVRDFVRGTSNVEDALGDVSDALDDVAADSQRSARKMADSQKDAARDIDQSNERLERSFKELADSSKRSTSQVGDDLARSTKHSTEQAGESVKEFGNEAKQNISETFSSFRGDVSDFGQIAQDTLGGLASGLNGIPAIAAVAAGAAGIGLILGSIETGKAETEEWKAKVADLAGAFIEAGGSGGAAALDHAVDTLKDMATATDGIKLADLAKDARTANLDLRKLGAALGGDVDALKEMWRETGKSNDAIWEATRAAQARGDANLEEKLNGESRATLKLQQQIGQQIGISKEAEAAYRAFVAAGGPELEVKSAALDSFAQSVQDALQDAGSAWEDYNQDGTTNLDEYNQHIEESIASTAAYQANVKTISQQVSQDALNYLLSLGEQAAPILQAYVDAPLAQQQRTAANWDSLGKTSGTSYTNALKSSIPSSVPGPTVVIDDVDTSRIIGQIRQTLDGHTFTVNAWANVRVGNAVG